MNNIIDLSIVVPVYNEEDSIIPLCRAILDSIEPLKNRFEIILVDDGSTDDTFTRAYSLAQNDERIRVIKLNKNFGQTAALYAGFEYATGDIIVTMDGDLQNDPHDIQRLLEKMQEGNDVVTGWRQDRQDKLINRKLPSRIANWLIRKVTGSPIIDNGCALRAYHSSVIKKFPLYSEMHRLLPTILSMAGVRIAQINVTHHARQYGESKYGLSRIYKVLFDLIALKTVLTAARFPLFGFGFFAVLAMLLTFISASTGFIYSVLHPDASVVIYLGASLLWGSLSIILLMLGILCTLIYSGGDLKIEDLLQSTQY